MLVELREEIGVIDLFQQTLFGPQALTKMAGGSPNSKLKGLRRANTLATKHNTDLALSKIKEFNKIKQMIWNCADKETDKIDIRLLYIVLNEIRVK